MQSRRGLSDIVTNVLIILLVLVAVGIIWAFVRPTINQGAGQLQGVATMYGSTLSVDASSLTINQTTQIVSLVVKRSEGAGALAGVNIVLYDASGASKVFRNNSILQPLESRRIYVNYAGAGLTGRPTKLFVVPIFALGGGEERQGTSSGDVVIPTTNTGGPSAPVCGNSIVEAGETCDPAGSLTNAACTVPGSGGILMGRYTCSSTCQSSNTCYCYADFTLDVDPVFDQFDLYAFQDCYDATLAGNPGACPAGHSADCNRDGSVNNADNTCFNDLFESGTCNA